MERPVVLGIDIGGSHITTALVNLETRAILSASYRRKVINSQGDAEKIIDSWCEIINDSFSNIEMLSKMIGIAMPGPFDYEEGISLMKDQDKFNAFYQVNIKKQLAMRLGIPADHIRFINDAVGFLQGEMFCGAGRNYNRVIGLTLGTGLGSAICIDGITEDADLWNSKFKEGIAEDYLSSAWFVNRYTELTGKTTEGVKELLELPNSELYTEEVFSEFAKNLSLFLMPLIKKYDTEVVVIGGNISKASKLFLPELKRLLEENKIESIIKITYLKEDASLVGAASCWEDCFTKVI